MKETEKSTIKTGDKLIAIKDVRINDSIHIYTGEICELYDIVSDNVLILRDTAQHTFAFVDKDISKYFMKVVENATFEKGDTLKAIKGSTISVDKEYKITGVYNGSVSFSCHTITNITEHKETYTLPIETVYRYFVKVSAITGIELPVETDDFENECMDCDGCAFYDECCDEYGNYNTAEYSYVDWLIENAEYEVFKSFDKCTIVSCRLPNGFVITESSVCIDPESYNEDLDIDICLSRIENKVKELEAYRTCQSIYEYEMQGEPCYNDCDDCNECCGFCGEEEGCEKYE